MFALMSFLRENQNMSDMYSVYWCEQSVMSPSFGNLTQHDNFKLIISL